MGQLNRKSDSADIKKYFEAICDLQASGKEFPVSLEDVWPLVYANKHKAIEALKNSDLFVKDADYQVFTRSGENPKGGRPSGEYWLSISCLEFFIARKKREVFEVYRQVFHKAMNQVTDKSDVMSESDAVVDVVRYVLSIPAANEVKANIIKRINQPEIAALPPETQIELYPASIGPKGEPVPVDEESGPRRSSATKLLHRCKAPIDVYEFNNALYALGYLEKRRVGWKSYNVLVGHGELYGCNVPNPYYRDQTTPMYWEDTFQELLDIVLSS